MNFNDILETMIEKKASDVFITAGSALRGRVCKDVKVINDHKLSEEHLNKIVFDLTDDRKKDILRRDRSCEFAYTHNGRWRFRVGIFYQRNTPSIVIRKLDQHVPTFQELNLPAKVLEKFCRERHGLVLLTGVTDSGKSTTIASMIEYINQNLEKHILTIEEPVEFIFKDQKSVINQREIGKDVLSYQDALRQFAIHSPDVIYIGLIRDQQTCSAALTAAETGVLVFSTIHSVNSQSTVGRIVNLFPPQQRQFVLEQLAFLLKGVISLRLLPRIDKSGLIPAYEIMTLSPTISRLIREDKLLQIPKYVASSDIYGMKSFDQCLLELVKAGKISLKVALEFSDRKDEIEMRLGTKKVELKNK